MNIIKKLNKNRKTTIINITHRMEEVFFADRVIVLKDGKILKQGTPQEIFSDYELLKESRLKLPQAAEIIKLLNEEGLVKKRVALNVEECVLILEMLLKRYS